MTRFGTALVVMLVAPEGRHGRAHAAPPGLKTEMETAAAQGLTTTAVNILVIPFLGSVDVGDALGGCGIPSHARVCPSAPAGAAAATPPCATAPSTGHPAT